MTGRALGLDLHLDAAPRGRSIEAALREAVVSGRLAAGTRLPGTRTLAADLGLARGTVVEAYAQLTAEGWLVSTTGAGTWVAQTSPSGRSAAPVPKKSVVDLRPGRPDLSLFPRATWVAGLRRALMGAEHSSLDYGDPAGLPVLREAVAAYVGRTRGVQAEAGAVVIVGGFSHGLAVLSRALRAQGVRTIGTEDPGLVHHREMIHRNGLATSPLSVGPCGAEPSESDLGAVLLTPAHQHPRGVVLGAEQRAGFLDWAERRDGYVIEDDYDGEFRYDKQPVGALQAQAPDRVVFAGSTSKSLAPGLRIGWLVVPERLRIAVLDAVVATGAMVSAPDQLTLAQLLEHGDYDRQVRRARQVYQRRRQELAARVRLDGVPAGLHALHPLESVEHEKRLIDAGLANGLHLMGLHTAGYWHSPDDDRAGLVIGYATPPQHAWRAALDSLATLLN
ncbi:PLP-dependent aminotransferase family protein [Kribbella sp. NPDC051770]|uniref:aminotransferase-like domain-containing protein n=1 Tax=Kribbella sp. NPDC051770 TaxID=3155413 RepID=UPI0034165D46